MKKIDCTENKRSRTNERGARYQVKVDEREKKVTELSTRVRGPETRRTLLKHARTR